MTNNEFLQFTPVRCASLAFDLDLGAITNSAGETQRLSPINLKLLTYLLKHHGQVVSRTELFDVIWPNQLLSDDVLTRAVSDIRTQLAKLDTETKFIETLPKRGYRWSLNVQFITPSDTSKSGIEQIHMELVDQSTEVVPAKGWMKTLIGYFSVAVILSLIFMWTISQLHKTPVNKIVMLPTVFSRPAIEPLAQSVDEALLNVLRKNTKVKLLSASAIKSRPQNPFPYFASEFGASWVIESRVTDLDGINTIELSLVDARSGIELRNLRLEIANRAEILHKVAQKLETELLVEQLPY